MTHLLKSVLFHAFNMGKSSCLSGACHLAKRKRNAKNTGGEGGGGGGELGKQVGVRAAAVSHLF